MNSSNDDGTLFPRESAGEEYWRQEVGLRVSQGDVTGAAMARHMQFVTRCLTYIPAEFLGDLTAEATVLNYLARMEDMHLAFPHIASIAVEPYGMLHVIPNQP